MTRPNMSFSLFRLICRNNLKNWEFGKEDPQNFYSERVTIAQRQDTSENENCEANTTQPNTDSSGCFGINGLGKTLFFPLVILLSSLQYGFADNSNTTFIDNCCLKITKPEIREGNGELVECYPDYELPLGNGTLMNWGMNISFSPKYVFVPKTKVGICNIVKWAASDEQDLKIRVSGYRHTWNPVYPDNGQVLISLLGLTYLMTDDSSSTVHDHTGAGKELKEIKYVPGCTEPNKIYCKVAGAVTNDELRAFCLNNQDPIHNSYWTIPLNVILVENTLSGTISSICHGAGHSNKTLSDLVEEIEFVNAKGELQVVNKAAQPELMRAAAGSFGLLGVITSITLKLDKMGYALTDPQFVDLSKAIPPPIGTRLDQLPEKLQKDLCIFSQKALDFIILQNSEKFFDRCKDYYAEWFWFILSKNCWINTWNKDDPENDNKNRCEWIYGGEAIYSSLLAWLQNGMSSFVELFDKENFKMPPPPFQEKFVRTSSDIITGLLSTHPRTLPLPEALHFQRGIRHIHVRDVEIEIPISLNQDGQPDWTICQKAWWDAIFVIYRHLEETGTLPVNLTLEMRIMGGSDITMAAQQGNPCTCSIEVLSTMVVPHDEWKALVEQIIGRWITYKDAQDKPLAIRTHWAKEWHGLQFNGIDANDFVRNTYQEAIPKFKHQLAGIAAAGGYTLDDMRKRFSNSLWDDIFFHIRTGSSD